MANSEATYLPHLDTCLSRNKLLLSWKAAYDILSDPSKAASSVPLRGFLESDTTQGILKAWLTPFDLGTDAARQHAKTVFATRTSPALFKHPEAKEIKEDTVWLANEAGLDELSALRIVLLARLDLPAARLRQEFTERDTKNLQDAANGTTLGASTNGFDASVRGDDVDALLPSPFETTNSRHLRLVHLYLNERLHVVRIGGILRRLESKGLGFRLGQEKAPEWLVSVAQAVAGQTMAENQNRLETWITVISAAESRIINLTPDVEDTQVAELWIWTQLSELNAMLAYLFHAVEVIDTVPDAPIVLAWFNFASSKAFFKDVAAVAPATSQMAVGLLQSLTAVISVSILQLSLMDSIDATNQGTITGEHDILLDTSYLSDTTCIGDLQRIFLNVAAIGPSPASPALFAWAALIMAMRDSALAFADDGQEALPYEDDLEPISRRQSLAARSSFEKATDVIRTSISATDRDAFKEIVQGAADTCQAHEVIATLAGALQSTLSGGIDDSIQVQARLVLLALLEKSASLTGYSSGLVAASIAVADGSRQSWARSDPDGVLMAAFATPDTFLNKLAAEARSRYPLETLPFLHFSKLQLQVSGLGEQDLPELLEGLRVLRLFTQMLPQGFQGYDTSSPDQDYNLVRLKATLQIFQSRKRAIANNRDWTAVDTRATDAEILLEDQSEGRAISDTIPIIVSWQHRHSALQYLANSLATVVASCDWSYASTGERMALMDAAEVISFFATSIETTLSLLLQSGKSTIEARIVIAEFLETLCDGFQPERDLVNVILDIFEQQLQNHCANPAQDGSTETLASCARFLSLSMPICSGRIWSFLSRSSLLELSGSGGSLVAVVEASEMVTGRYDFLISCLQLYEAVVEDAVNNSVARKSTKPATRFAKAISFNSTPDKAISALLHSFTATVMGLFGSSLEWRFSSTEDKFEVQTSTIRILGRILGYAYSFDDSRDNGTKLTAVVNDSAKYIVETFTDPSVASLVARPVLQILYDATAAPYDQLTPSQTKAWKLQREAALDFLTLLLKTTSLLGLPAPSLQATLFRITPLLGRLYATCETSQKQAILLLEVLVKSAAKPDSEPPSLLGYMGPEAAKNFLMMLTEATTSPLADGADVAVWDLCSAVVSCKQQWFATYVLTGSTAKEALRSKKDGGSSTAQTTMFKYALDRLAAVADLDLPVATALLKFVSLSQNYWPRVIRDIRKHNAFLEGIFAYLGTLKRNEREKDLGRLTISCQETRIASLIAEILAMCIHFARQLGDFSIAEKLAPKLSYFKEFGASPPKYNTSLHSNLKKNIEAKYPGCKLESFKRTELQASDFGINFYYDLEYVSSILGFDPQWSKKHSIQQEFPRANVDLALVEAQIELLHSWKLLAIELSTVSDKIPQLQDLLISVIEKCLDANTAQENPPALFERLVQVRADFAFVLLQRLLRTSVPLKKLAPLFQQVWDAIRSSGIDFEIGLASPNADYYRSLLKLLLLSLKPHLEGSATSAPSHIKLARPGIAGPLLEVLDRVVAVGFRALCTQLHDSPEDVTSADFVLLTAILQSALRVPAIGSLHSQITTLFTLSDVVRYATSLFSWADVLAINADADDPDPIYGELSVLFLLELSSVRTLAESMAVEGVLASLSSSKICEYFQRERGSGPFDEPIRLFSIWNKGLLPLSLNILDAVGAPVAAELATFANQFAPQLARNARALDTRTTLGKGPRSRGAEPYAGTMTLGLASETHSLALLNYMLSQAKELGSSVGVDPGDIEDLEWDVEGVKENLRSWTDGSTSLAGRVVPVGDVETRLLGAEARGKAKKANNALEERILAELRGAYVCLNGGDEGS